MALKIRFSSKRDFTYSSAFSNNNDVFLVIEELLLENHFKIISQNGNKIVFKLETSGLLKHNIGLYSDRGEIKIVKTSNSTSLELTYYISVIIDLIGGIWACYLGYSISKSAYFGILIMVLYFAYRQKVIRNKAEEMMDDIAYAIS